jgi:hypothetical protein
MPLQNCTDSGKSGWRWGKSGKCYTGPDGKKKAIQQGISIEGPEKFQRMASAGEVGISENDIPLVSYALHDSGYSLTSTVAVVATIRDTLSRADKEAGYPPNCNPGYEEKGGKCLPVNGGIEAKEMTRKKINDLPDSDFAYISPGGEKDSSGKTTPRSLRHLPIHDAAHVRNALARLSQTDIPASAKKSALQKIKRAAKKFGIGVGE